MPRPRGTITYKIKPGDTFYSIAKRFNTTVASLRSVNPGLNPKDLQIGQLIYIPVRRKVVPCPPANRYTIKAGDTFSKLARRYGIPVSTLTALNPGVNPLELQVGQIICLPVRKRRRF
ncbi:MAG: LysM peptidoglycan-binding domain-containing protein [Desulfitobacteriia bacterium]|jgi:LysM repeat protein